MIDIDKTIPSVEVLKFDGYSIEVARDRTSLWYFLKGNRKELPASLSNKYMNLRQAQVAFESYVKSLVSYVPGKKGKDKD